MNDQEKFLFDLRGYIVVKNVLTTTQLKDLSDRLEQHRKIDDKRHFGSDRTKLPSDDAPAWSSPSLIEWGGAYHDLIDLPKIEPYLTTLLGDGYRLDHDYSTVINEKTGAKLYLHGGGQGAGGPKDVVGFTDGGQCYYRYNNDKFFNGLVAVAFELDDVHPDSGGFACVPASHKMNFPLPPDSRVSETQEDIPSWVDRVQANAGDAIIFTEACSHGTVPWKGGGERRTIFYKYCPHAVAWGACFYNADHYEGLTDRQRELLKPPSAYGPHQHVDAIWRRVQEEQRELLELRRLVKQSGQEISSN